MSSVRLLINSKHLATDTEMYDLLFYSEVPKQLPYHNESNNHQLISYRYLYIT